MDKSTIGLVNDFESDKNFNITELKLKIPTITKWRFSAKRINIKCPCFKI